MSVKVEFTNKRENPFFGMEKTLQIFQNASKGNLNFDLDGAWKECGNSLQKKALLFSILFSIGDIPRQHNVFDAKVSTGGYASRETFRDKILPWIWTKIKASKKVDNIEFLKLVVEYTVLDNILATRVKTKKNTQNIIQTINMIEVFGIDELVNVLSYYYVKGTEFQKVCLAKFLVLPKARKQKETQKLHKVRTKLLKKFCKNVKLPFIEKDDYINFTGYKSWRSKYNKYFDSVLFSSNSVHDLDQESFLKILNSMPAGARFRTRVRLLTKDNKPKKESYTKLANYYLAWEGYKEEKQAEQRVLEDKVSQGIATEEDKKQLHKVKKQAKVNVGAVNFTSLFNNIVIGNMDKVAMQSILDMIKLPYNNLLFIDDSGSMRMKRGDYQFKPRDFAAFMATICMMKNPSNEARNLIGLFSSNCRIFNHISKTSTSPNSLMTGTIKETSKPLINMKKDFFYNLASVRAFLDANSEPRSTNVASIARFIINWLEKDPTAVEQLQNYPIWTLISDGNFNNMSNAMTSLGECFKLMENKVGFKPFVILIDVAGSSSQDIRNFTGLDNVMYVPPSPVNIELFLTNFRDLDVYDIYTPLQSVYRDNRYAPIRELIGAENSVAVI